MKSEKVCSKCLKVKPVTAFHRFKNSGDGYYPSCKECRRPVSMKYRLENREVLGAYYEKYRKRKLDEKQLLFLYLILTYVVWLPNRHTEMQKYLENLEFYRLCKGFIEVFDGYEHQRLKGRSDWLRRARPKKNYKRAGFSAKKSCQQREEAGLLEKLRCHEKS